MLLLVTNQRDITTDYIVLELKRRGIDYFRLNTELLPSSLCRMSNLFKSDWKIIINDKAIQGADITGAYFRRPGKPEVSNSNDQDVSAYIELEWASFLKSLYMRLDDLWLNSPTNIILAEDKPRQLLLANELGFNIPETIISNDIDDAKEFSQDGDIIIKPLRQSLFKSEHQEKVIFTSRIMSSELNSKEEFSVVPMIVQKEIKKKYDVRVTVVGSKIFPVAIYSQEKSDTEVDWRYGAHTDLKYQRISLPDKLNEKCIELTKKLGLKFGAIDLICDLNNKFWFLEINPNGQWAWIENQTGCPISGAIVDELIKNN